MCIGVERVVGVVVFLLLPGPSRKEEEEEGSSDGGGGAHNMGCTKRNNGSNPITPGDAIKREGEEEEE